jgi:hypothetical protein
MEETDKEILDRKTIEEIQKEFPGDPALQQIHLARKRISLSAKAKGLNLRDYIKSLKGRTQA